MKWDALTIISIVNGVINLVLLTFLVNFFKTFREIAKEREDLIKEQKNLSDTKTQVVEKELAFTDRQNRQLTAEKEQLQKQLAEVLKSGGINVDFLLNNGSLQNLTSEFTSKVEAITKKLEDVQEAIKSNKQSEIVDGEYHLSVGNGFLVNKEWKKAAYHLEIALLSYLEDWNLHLTIGICYANVRGGRLINIKSIEAYTRAIAYMPVIDKEVKGKTYIYRGAMLKRINKLDEAEIDVKFGLSQTTSRRFQSDGLYNLACIYAMRNEREKLFQVMNMLKPANTYMNTIRHHLKDYFRNFENDKEFIAFISATQ